MQNNTTKKKTKVEPKPYLKGNAFSGVVVKKALRIFLYQLVAAFIFLIFSSMLMFDTFIITAILNVVILLAAGAIFFASGAASGEADVTLGETLYKHQAQGRSISDNDRNRSFHVLKGFIAAILGVIPFLVLTSVLAANTKVTLYESTSLPSWLSGFTRIQEIGGALAYSNAPVSVTGMDILRIAVRAMLMPYVAIVTNFGDQAAVTLEKLSPLLILINPLLYAIGYTTGPARRSLVHENIAAGKRRNKARARRDKMRRDKGPEQLV